MAFHICKNGYIYEGLERGGGSGIHYSLKI